MVALPVTTAAVLISHPVGQQWMPVLLIGMGVGGLIATIPMAFVGLNFNQAPYLVLDRQVPVFESFGLSKTLMVGNKGTLFFIWLLEAAVYIAGDLPCCVGVFFALPFLRLLNVVVYLALIGDKSVSPPPGEQPM